MDGPHCASQKLTGVSKILTWHIYVVSGAFITGPKEKLMLDFTHGNPTTGLSKIGLVKTYTNLY